MSFQLEKPCQRLVHTKHCAIVCSRRNTNKNSFSPGSGGMPLFCLYSLVAFLGCVDSEGFAPWSFHPIAMGLWWEMSHQWGCDGGETHSVETRQRVTLYELEKVAGPFCVPVSILKRRGPRLPWRDTVNSNECYLGSISVCLAQEIPQKCWSLEGG